MSNTGVAEDVGIRGLSSDETSVDYGEAPMARWFDDFDSE